MNFELKGRNLVNADIITPEVVYATFSEDVRIPVIKSVTAKLNYGSRFLDIYEQHRDDMSVPNVLKMLKKMEEVFVEYDYHLYAARRSKEK